jgi:hypothetical protein
MEVNSVLFPVPTRPTMQTSEPARQLSTTRRLTSRDLQIDPAQGEWYALLLLRGRRLLLLALAAIACGSTSSSGTTKDHRSRLVRGRDAVVLKLSLHVDRKFGRGIDLEVSMDPAKGNARLARSITPMRPNATIMSVTEVKIIGNIEMGCLRMLKYCSAEKMVAASSEWPVRPYTMKVRTADNTGMNDMVAVMVARLRPLRRSLAISSRRRAETFSPKKFS